MNISDVSQMLWSLLSLDLHLASPSALLNGVSSVRNIPQRDSSGTVADLAAPLAWLMFAGQAQCRIIK